MKGLILAGGKSTRLYPLTFALPKPMVPVLNRPFLEHMIDWLRAHRVRDIILATGYLPEAIQAHFRSGRQYGVHIEYVVEDTPLDTGGAIKNCEALLDEPFFVFNGDILTGLDLSDMAAQHARTRAQVSISLAWVEDPTAYGVIETDDSGRILSFQEKPKPEEVTSHYINAGTYLFDPEMLTMMPSSARFSIEKDFYPQALGRGVHMYGYRDSSYWLDIGTTEKYIQAHRDILSGKLDRRGNGELIAPGIWAGIDTDIAADARLIAPSVAGERCVIGAKAVVGPFAVLGDDVRVEAGAHVADSVVWNGTVIGAGARVERCVAGREVVIAPGMRLEGRAFADQEQVLSEAA
jgi:mannose-1-phosphate guanylyltransferase